MSDCRKFTVLNVRETLSFQHVPKFWEQPEVSWSQVRRLRRMIHDRYAPFFQKLILDDKNVLARCHGKE
jgi:hypothetical protein